MRAFIEACPVVLGTATPSLESLQNTLTSRYKVHYLSHRADDASMPEVRYIDLRQQRKLGNMKGTLSEPLIAAIKERVERKEGVILFLNRRGYAASLQCNDCGAAPECPNCDVTLTWHKASSTLRCHYCGHQEPRHTACQQCGSLELHEIGTGTQRVEEDVRAIFEGTSTVIERMDTDTMKRRGAHRRLLQRFAAGDVDIIIGTQMVAKGLDIPRVTLVGVINADQSLFQNDFRSAERTAQLLTQVAGRAGRSREHPGLVMVQTSNAEHSAISGNYQDFIKDELDERLAAGYPPFSRFIVIEISGKQDQEVEHVSRILDRLLPAKHPCMERFPPVSPSISKIRNRYRRVIVVKNLKQVDPNGSQCRALLSAALRDYTLNHALSTVRVTVDMDASGAV